MKASKRRIEVSKRESLKRVVLFSVAFSIAGDVFLAVALRYGIKGVAKSFA